MKFQKMNKRKAVSDGLPFGIIEIRWSRVTKIFSLLFVDICSSFTLNDLLFQMLITK